jgi:aminoglycoside phosphotransferase (APT) family kinase protein
MPDAAGGSVVCHNDVCLENVVFRGGVAVALLDFEFVAPGRPAYDLAAMARMCVPIDPDSSMFGFAPNNAVARLRLVTDAYGLDASGRGEFLAILDEGIRRSGEFVARRVAAGEQGFIDMWNAGGGQARFDRRRAWYATERDRIAAALA